MVTILTSIAIILFIVFGIFYLKYSENLIRSLKKNLEVEKTRLEALKTDNQGIKTELISLKNEFKNFMDNSDINSAKLRKLERSIHRVRKRIQKQQEEIINQEKDIIIEYNIKPENFSK